MPHSFRAKLFRPPERGSWTYAIVPKRVSARLPARGQVRVVGTVDGRAIDTTILPMGDGTHALIVKKELRTILGKESGATVDVTIEPTDKPLSVAVPAELKAALAKDKVAKAEFDAMPRSHRKECAGYVAEAKKPETRERRAAKTVETLRRRA